MARVTVCVRKRPLSRKELASGDRDVVTIQPDASALAVHELREKVDLTKYVDTHPFIFDRVFPDHASNPAVYEGTARPLVDTLFAGGRATCFAYGQTGAGKTFTMAGDSLENPGLYTLAVRDVFDRIRSIESELWRNAEAEGDDDFEPPEPAQVWISFYEIYASKLQDLLNRSAKLACREDSNSQVQIVGLTQRLCEVEEDVLACIDEGSAARSTGVTGANDDSSRSHAVFQIELRHPQGEVSENDPSAAMRESILRTTRSRVAAAKEAKRGAEIGRLCFIDLAGSERGSDTASSTRQTRMEGAEINKSLLALKECIRAMDQKKDHTPFRGSKLTQVLKASFMGKKCSTVMIANISPASSNVEHTLNTLRYSDRVKEMKKDRNGNAMQNMDFSFPTRPSLGGRRATFSHGIGLRPGRNLMNTPLRTTQRQASFDAEIADEVEKFLEPPPTDRKMLRSQTFSRQVDRPTDKIDSRPSISRAGSRTGRRPLIRTKSQDLENFCQGTGAPPVVTALKKGRESRVTRRRTSRVPTMIPSRPSIGGAALPKPDLMRSSGEPRISRTNSSIGRLQSSDNGSQSVRTQGKAKSHDGGNGQTKRARLLEERSAPLALKPTAAGPSPHTSDEASTSEGEAKVLDLSSRSLDSEDLELERPRTGDVPLRRRGSAANAAQSAMKFYMTNKPDELPDEDLLFASTESLADEATAAAQQRLVAASAEAEKRDSVERPISPRSRAIATAGGEALRRNQATVNADVTPPSSQDTSPSGSFAVEASGSSKQPSPELRTVLRFHHVQIEELMRLTESDVALVNAAEKGDMDPDEYALKLKLNLSQKLDIVTALQAKLRLLE